jgi:hypothetical protein
MFTGPNIITDGLVLALDAANNRSYPGTGTTWSDLSGNGNSGTLTNGPTFNSGNGGSIVFDGVDDYIVTPDPQLPQYEWTIDVVIKCNDYSNSPIFLSPNSAGIDHFLRFSSSNKIVFQVTTAADVGNRNVQSNYTAAVGEILHLTFIRTSTYKSIFIDGQLDIQSIDEVESAAWAGTWRFGTRGNTTFPLNGNIYSSKSYNRVLSSEEIQQNYNATKIRYGL